MGFLLFAADGAFTAFSCAETTAVAELWIDFIAEKRGAHPGVAFPIADVALKFVEKVSQGGLHRVGSRLP
jgi:hypothetical protein